jgi:hypothetical protein
MPRRVPVKGKSSQREHPLVLRVWGVGFVIAARGTMWLTRKTLRLLPFTRSKRANEDLVDELTLA